MTVALINQSSVLFDQPHYILARLFILGTNNTAQIGQNFGLGDANFRPFLSLHVLGLLLVLEFVQIFLTLSIFVHQFGVLFDVKQHFPHLVVKLAIAITASKQFGTGTILLLQHPGRGNNLLLGVGQ